MSIKRDDFPATSIGRTGGNRLQNPSSLEGHPLLSPRPASPAPSEHGSITAGVSLINNIHRRYVAYTPRQKVTSAAATTGTTVHPPSPQHQSGDATSKLQLLHLKAAAQTIGLDSDTLGWAMLEKLVLDAEVGDEWTAVWNAITIGKATLLLPLEAAFTNEKITPDFMKDHIAFYDSPSRDNAPIVTLSGLYGTLEDNTLTFRSTINPSSKEFQDLFTPSMPTSGLSRLPPLPSPFPNLPPVSYPQYQVTTHTSSLHFPPRSQIVSKPPLPPRPGSRSHPPPISTSRLGNPFASLFGGAKATPQSPPSPPTSVLSFDSQNDSNAPVEVSGFAINRRIVRRDLAKEINKALQSELTAAIKSRTQTGFGSLPHWVRERIHHLIADWYPFINEYSNGAMLNKKDSVDTSPNDAILVVNSINQNLEDISNQFHDFFASLEQDLRLNRGQVERGSESEVEEAKDREKRKQGETETEVKIRDTLEVIERLICWLFYERLFRQPTTDDALHDEALSNRIVALNQLDLGLGHLGIDIGEVNESDLNTVVNACGEMLGQLDSCRCPADKASILVAAHKIIVDGLTRLPPVRLISEDEATSQDGNSDSALTAKPTLSPCRTTTVLDDSTELNPEPSATSIPGSQASVAPTSSDTISLPIAEGDRPPSSVEDILPAVEPKIKPVPPPLDLDNPRPRVPLPLKEPTPISGDVLFPLIIFSVVKANPARLVSNLLFTQRFRNSSIGGEESYCLINMMAVAEFLENVDMAALGLDNTDKALSTANLTPILPSRSPTTETSFVPSDGAVAALRGRVEQQVDVIADSANKVISGVVDSSFGILRSFMHTGTAMQPTRTVQSGRTTPGKPGFGLLKRDGGSLITNLAASLPITGRSRMGASSGNGEETGQQMMSVSRPASRLSPSEEENGDDNDDGEEDGKSGSSSEDSEEGDAESKEENGIEPEEVVSGDTKRITSFESMLSASKEDRKGAAHRQHQPRKTLSDRLASVSALATSNPKGSSPDLQASHKRSKSTTVAVPSRSDSPVSHVAEYTVSASAAMCVRLAPPKQRFMECTADDLRLSEVGELLREYRRLAGAIHAAGGFEAQMDKTENT